MNKKIYLFILFISLFAFNQCKNESTAANNDPFLMPMPKDCYRPPGLIQLSMKDMYDLRTNPDLIKVPLKDKYGNDVPRTILNDPTKPMFIQMFANDSNRIVVGIVYETTDEVRNMMLKVLQAEKKNK